MLFGLIWGLLIALLVDIVVYFYSLASGKIVGVGFALLVMRLVRMACYMLCLYCIGLCLGLSCTFGRFIA